MPTNMAVGIGARGAAGARLVFRFLRGDGADGAGDPDRRHDARLVHPDGGRGRGRDLVAVPGAGALSLDDAADVAKATFDTIETTASVLFIVTAASIFAWLLTVSQAAQT